MTAGPILLFFFLLAYPTITYANIVYVPFPLPCSSAAVAVIYYLLNMRATIKLGDPIYYNKGTWVALVRQVSESLLPPLKKN